MISHRTKHGLISNSAAVPNRTRCVGRGYIPDGLTTLEQAGLDRPAKTRLQRVETQSRKGLELSERDRLCQTGPIEHLLENKIFGRNRHLAGIARERDCGRMEWSVLDWNTPAIDFYKSLGARPMSEWTVYRLDASALENLQAR